MAEPRQPSDFRYIQLSHRSHAILDPDDFERLKRYHWRLKRSGACFYAVRRYRKDGSLVEVKMHREVAHTLPGFECHHINHRTLDNRKCNLENLTPEQHQRKHTTSLI